MARKKTESNSNWEPISTGNLPRQHEIDGGRLCDLEENNSRREKEPIEFVIVADMPEHLLLDLYWGYRVNRNYPVSRERFERDFYMGEV